MIRRDILDFLSNVLSSLVEKSHTFVALGIKVGGFKVVVHPKQRETMRAQKEAMTHHVRP